MMLNMPVGLLVAHPTTPQTHRGNVFVDVSGSAAVWPTWHGQDAACAGGGPPHKLLPCAESHLTGTHVLRCAWSSAAAIALEVFEHKFHSVSGWIVDEKSN